MELDPLSTEPTDQDRLLLVFAYLGPLAVFSLVATRRDAQMIYYRLSSRPAEALLDTLYRIYCV